MNQVLQCPLVKTVFHLAQIWQVSRWKTPPFPWPSKGRLATESTGLCSDSQVTSSHAQGPVHLEVSGHLESYKTLKHFYARPADLVMLAQTAQCVSCCTMPFYSRLGQTVYVTTTEITAHTNNHAGHNTGSWHFWGAFPSSTGYPLTLRSSLWCGGAGSGFSTDMEEEACRHFSHVPRSSESERVRSIRKSDSRA